MHELSKMWLYEICSLKKLLLDLTYANKNNLSYKLSPISCYPFASSISENKLTITIGNASAILDIEDELLRPDRFVWKFSYPILSKDEASDFDKAVFKIQTLNYDAAENIINELDFYKRQRNNLEDYFEKINYKFINIDNYDINPPVKSGDKIKILSMSFEPLYIGRTGMVTNIDDAKQIHGTWGGCSIISEEDIYVLDS